MPTLAPQEYEKNPLYLRPGETPEQYQARTSKSNTGLTQLPGQEQKEAGASGFTNFAAALNKAVSLARNQRQSADLDMLGKQIKPGSVSASSFTSLLSDINTASSRYSDPLVQSATDMAAQEQTRIANEKTSIKELALTLVQSGAKREVIEGILNAPSIDSAIAMSAGALNSTSKGEVRQVGSSLVTVDPTTGAVDVLYTAPNGGGASSGDANTGFFKSGALKIDNADIGEGSRILSESRGDDGFVNTDQYNQMYKHWVDNGGLPQDFFKQYDPDYYLNPNDPTVPTYVKSQMKTTKEEDTNPFK
ncbi:MAG: hypothetical protein QG621_617 [Patescibacteria group bacterium]|nr:hypothetical protein [Patescibacteria group bacterium]